MSFGDNTGYGVCVCVWVFCIFFFSFSSLSGRTHIAFNRQWCLSAGAIKYFPNMGGGRLKMVGDDGKAHYPMWPLSAFSVNFFIFFFGGERGRLKKRYFENVGVLAIATFSLHFFLFFVFSYFRSFAVQLNQLETLRFCKRTKNVLCAAITFANCIKSCGFSGVVFRPRVGPVGVAFAPMGWWIGDL